VSTTERTTIELDYGGDSPGREQPRFRWDIAPERVAADPSVPAPLPDLAAAVRTALRAPLGFPPLEHAVIPDDRVVIALAPGTPGAATLVAACWEAIQRRGVPAAQVTILLGDGAAGADGAGGATLDPRAEIPAPARDEIVLRRHRPGEVAECHYLASTANGERIYLAGELTDAEVVITVGAIEYDPIIGYRGTSSVFYPGLSSAEAVAKSRGQGHQELGPDDERPLRQMIDEIGWLLGAEFTVQVVPSGGGGVADVIAGAHDAVLRRGKELLNAHYRVELDERADAVVAAIDAAGPDPWAQLGATVATARNLVARDGRIVLLTDIAAEPGPGVRLLADCEEPAAALARLRQVAPPDLVPATQLADALQWANIYLLSRLPEELVEDLFCFALADGEDVRRLLRDEGRILFLGAAQHRYGHVRSG
jgi:nickel-dependent lactate racemase